MIEISKNKTKDIIKQMENMAFAINREWGDNCEEVWELIEYLKRKIG